jgi:hypothetical protein
MTLSTNAFAITSLTLASCGVVFAMVTMILLLINLIRNRDVALLLLLNSYFTILLFCCVSIAVFSRVCRIYNYGITLMKDDELSPCRLEGFLIFLSGGLYHLSFFIQSMYRLLRIIYAKRKFLQVTIHVSYSTIYLAIMFQSLQFNVGMIVVSWLIFSLIVLLSRHWPNDDLYTFLPSDYVCTIPYDKYSGLFFMVFMGYFLPAVLVAVIYLRLLIYLRYQLLPSSASTHQRSHCRWLTQYHLRLCWDHSTKHHRPVFHVSDRMRSKK